MQLVILRERALHQHSQLDTHLSSQPCKRTCGDRSLDARAHAPEYSHAKVCRHHDGHAAHGDMDVPVNLAGRPR